MKINDAVWVKVSASPFEVRQGLIIDETEDGFLVCVVAEGEGVYKKEDLSPIEGEWVVVQHYNDYVDVHTNQNLHPEVIYLDHRKKVEPAGGISKFRKEDRYDDDEYDTDIDRIHSWEDDNDPDQR